jgi:hypothetical protein
LVKEDFKALMDRFILEVAKSIKEGCKGERWEREEILLWLQNDRQVNAFIKFFETV